MAAARVLGSLVFQDVQVQILLGTPNSNIKVKNCSQQITQRGNIMTCTKARIQASVKYNRKRDNIMLRPSKEDGARIRKAAADAGLSVQKFILTLVFAYIDDEGEKNG